MTNFNETNVRELSLYIVNDGQLYTTRTQSIINNLSKKYQKGTFDYDKSLKVWYQVATEGAKKYSKEFSTGNDGLTMFSVDDRKRVSEILAEYYAEQIEED